MSAPTYKEYVEQVQPQSKLEGKIEDLNLCEIADVLKDWESLAPFLQLDDTTISDIGDPKRKAAHQRRDALKAWKTKFAFRATYGSLLKICVDHGETACAMKIIDLLKTDTANGGTATSPGHPQAGNYPQGGGQQPPSQQAKKGFSEDFGTEELYAWLRANQVPETDCAKIKGQDIGGVGFKLILECDGWEEYNISLSKMGSMIINKRIKKMVLGSDSEDGPGSAVMGGGTAAAQPPPQQNGSSILDEIDGTTKLSGRDQAQLSKTIKDLSPEEVTELGTNLGLSLPRLNKQPGTAIHGQMIHFWLIGTDNCRDVDPEPTWRVFARGLLDIGQDGIVREIKKAHPRR